MPLNLSGAYLMDAGEMLPQNIQGIAEDIARKYENLKLIWIPLAKRNKEDTHPYALVDMNSGFVIKEFTDISIHTAMQWLWENDSQRIDTYKKHMKEKDEAAAIQRSITAEEDNAKLDLAGSILGSKLHTFKHAGKTYTEGYKSNAR